MSAKQPNPAPPPGQKPEPSPAPPRPYQYSGLRADACPGAGTVGASPHAPALLGVLKLESTKGEVLFVQLCKHCAGLYVQHKGLKPPKPPPCEGTGKSCYKDGCASHAGQPCPVCPGCVDCT